MPKSTTDPQFFLNILRTNNKIDSFRKLERTCEIGRGTAWRALWKAGVSEETVRRLFHLRKLSKRKKINGLQKRNRRSQTEIQNIARFHENSEYTLEEMRVFLGNVSRERVRQIVREGGSIRFAHGGTGKTDDPIRLLRVLRSQREIFSLSDLAKKSGHNHKQVMRILTGLELLPAVERLLRIRRGGRLSAKWLQKLRDVANEIGHTPSSYELLMYGAHLVNYVRIFGSLRKAQELAGLVPNSRGGNKSRKQVPKGTWNKRKILRILRATAKELGHTASVRELAQKGLRSTTVLKHFGSVSKAQHLAGLIPNKGRRPRR